MFSVYFHFYIEGIIKWWSWYIHSAWLWYDNIHVSLLTLSYFFILCGWVCLIMIIWYCIRTLWLCNVESWIFLMSVAVCLADSFVCEFLTIICEIVALWLISFVMHVHFSKVIWKLVTLDTCTVRGEFISCAYSICCVISHVY